jgi:hypothetical protein
MSQALPIEIRKVKMANLKGGILASVMAFPAEDYQILSLQCAL